MNVLIPFNWLKDYIRTNASEADIANYLPLHSFSVEKIIDDKNDKIFDIEITPNRGDALSVIGIARELKVVLPKYGFSAEWIQKKPTENSENIGGNDRLDVDIESEDMVPRFSAIVLDNVTIKDSPDFIKERLEQVGIRALGNVIDITNYMMIDKGQPMHAFDYDKILGHKMIVRESKEGEVVTTLDGVDRKLPQGVIVIEDGEGRLIDLCGIMGAKNSEVDENTKKVLLFVQVYDPVRIRKASMSLGHRTDAALRFEKGIDPEGVIPALWESVQMMKDYAGATVSSMLIDIVNKPYKQKEVYIDYEKINKVAGIEINKAIVDETLTSLGFEVKGEKVLVPSWRHDDIDICEDLAEEVIRIHGYNDLPNNLPEGQIPIKSTDPSFYWENFVKTFLKYQGFFECYTYSTTNKRNVDKDAIGIKNPLSEDFAYLKTSLIPQLLEVADKNKGYSNVLKIFELADVYLRSDSGLPAQPKRLALVTKGVDYLSLRGIVQALFAEMGIKEDVPFEIREHSGEKLAVEIEFSTLLSKATKTRSYVPLTGFNSIKEDLTLDIPAGVSYDQIVKNIMETDSKIKDLEFKDMYKNFLTLSIEYLDREKQISSGDTKLIRQNIFEKLEKELGVKLKA